MIIKQVFTKRYHDKEDEEEKGKQTMSFIASTDRPDRYGDVINQAGWDLEAYRSNPVILLNHDHNSLPIGKGNVRIGPEGLMIDVDFDMEDPRAAEIAGKVERGYLNAVSVGFTPLKSESRASLPQEHSAYSNQGGSYFDKAELLEVSIVTIPANADATSVAAKSMDAELRSMVRMEVENSINTLPVHSILRHILDIKEDDNTFTIVFAKHNENMDDMEEMTMDENEDMEEMGMKEDEEDLERDALIKALLQFKELK